MFQWLQKRSLVAVPFLLLLFSSGCGNAPVPKDAAITPTRKPTIVFMTDFGTANDAVAICRAVIAGIVPDARIMDITHQVTPFQIEEASRYLYGVTPYYPAGTVFLVVVDPGVGTSRKAVIVRSKKGQFFVVPDNGLVSAVIDRDGFEGAREITNQHWMIQAGISSTFHGRDIFSPAAAHLAAGWDYTIAGPEVPQLVRLTAKTAKVDVMGVTGEIIGLDDPFGSLVSDVSKDELESLGYSLDDKIAVQINHKPVTLPYVKTFMNVPVGASLLYVDSRGRVGIAVNQGNYSRKFSVEPPATLFIPRKGGAAHHK
jgi:hypothetical protein